MYQALKEHITAPCRLQRGPLKHLLRDKNKIKRIKDKTPDEMKKEQENKEFNQRAKRNKNESETKERAGRKEQLSAASFHYFILLSAQTESPLIEIIHFQVLVMAA